MKILAGLELEMEKKTECSFYQKNFQLNNFTGNYNFYCSDVFDFIDKNDLSSYDIIILDPPAFAKKRNTPHLIHP